MCFLFFILYFKKDRCNCSLTYTSDYDICLGFFSYYFYYGINSMLKYCVFCNTDDLSIFFMLYMSVCNGH